MRTRFLFVLAASALLCAAPARAAQSDPILDAAEAYAAYRADVGALRDTRLRSISDLEAALDRAARHNRAALARGWIAEGALAASRSRAFANGLASVARRYGRTQVLRALVADPAYPERRRGYADALSLILAASAADRAAADAAAARLEGEAAEARAWPDLGAAAGDRADRLRALGAAPFVSRAETRRLAAAGTERISERMAERMSARRLRMSPARVALARRMTTLAAMRLLGAEGDWRRPMQRMLDDASVGYCLQMANLQFYQCVSVTHTPDEAAHCLARHALREASGCMSVAT